MTSIGNGNAIISGLRDTVLATRDSLPFSFALRSGDGSVTTIGEGAPSFELHILNDAGIAAVRSLSELEICEAYVRGDIDFTGDLMQALELRYLLSDNKPLIRLWARLQPLLLGRKRCNPQWIAKHYDSDNMQLWALDEAYNTYTPGIYADGDTMEQGALRKLESAHHALRLQPGDSLLDVGCGWGGFLRYCAQRGVKATGITLSRHQLEYARNRIRQDGLDASVLYADFFSFEPTRRFDAISMMGVLEDLSDYRRVMPRVAAWLRPGGRVYCDFASSDRRFGISSFVTKHIWPGVFRMVYLPEFTAAIAGSTLDIAEIQNDRDNYYLWARLGSERWMHRRAEVVAAADEQTWRMMRVLMAGTAYVMGPSSTGTTAYRVVLEARPPRSVWDTGARPQRERGNGEAHWEANS